jgi:hypothetical protein
MLRVVASHSQAAYLKLEHGAGAVPVACPIGCFGVDWADRSPDSGADEVGQFLGRLVARLRVAGELRES